MGTRNVQGETSASLAYSQTDRRLPQSDSERRRHKTRAGQTSRHEHGQTSGAYPGVYYPQNRDYRPDPYPPSQHAAYSYPRVPAPPVNKPPTSRQYPVPQAPPAPSIGQVPPNLYASASSRSHRHKPATAPSHSHEHASRYHPSADPRLHPAYATTSAAENSRVPLLSNYTQQPTPEFWVPPSTEAQRHRQKHDWHRERGASDSEGPKETTQQKAREDRHRRRVTLETAPVAAEQKAVLENRVGREAEKDMVQSSRSYAKQELGRPDRHGEQRFHHGEDRRLDKGEQSPPGEQVKVSPTLRRLGSFLDDPESSDSARKKPPTAHGHRRDRSDRSSRSRPPSMAQQQQAGDSYQSLHSLPMEGNNTNTNAIVPDEFAKAPGSRQPPPTQAMPAYHVPKDLKPAKSHRHHNSLAYTEAILSGSDTERARNETVYRPKRSSLRQRALEGAQLVSDPSSSKAPTRKSEDTREIPLYQGHETDGKDIKPGSRQKESPIWKPPDARIEVPPPTSVHKAFASITQEQHPSAKAAPQLVSIRAAQGPSSSPEISDAWYKTTSSAQAEGYNPQSSAVPSKAHVQERPLPVDHGPLVYPSQSQVQQLSVASKLEPPRVAVAGEAIYRAPVTADGLPSKPIQYALPVHSTAAPPTSSQVQLLTNQTSPVHIKSRQDHASELRSSQVPSSKPISSTTSYLNPTSRTSALQTASTAAKKHEDMQPSTSSNPPQNVPVSREAQPHPVNLSVSTGISTAYGSVSNDRPMLSHASVFAQKQASSNSASRGTTDTVAQSIAPGRLGTGYPHATTSLHATRQEADTSAVPREIPEDGKSALQPPPAASFSRSISTASANAWRPPQPQTVSVKAAPQQITSNVKIAVPYVEESSARMAHTQAALYTSREPAAPSEVSKLQDSPSQQRTGAPLGREFVAPMAADMGSTGQPSYSRTSQQTSGGVSSTLSAAAVYRQSYAAPRAPDQRTETQNSPSDLLKQRGVASRGQAALTSTTNAAGGKEETPEKALRDHHNLDLKPPGPPTSGESFHTPSATAPHRVAASMYPTHHSTASREAPKLNESPSQPRSAVLHPPNLNVNSMGLQTVTSRGPSSAPAATAFRQVSLPYGNRLHTEAAGSTEFSKQRDSPSQQRSAVPPEQETPTPTSAAKVEQLTPPRTVSQQNAKGCQSAPPGGVTLPLPADTTRHVSSSPHDTHLQIESDAAPRIVSEQRSSPSQSRTAAPPTASTWSTPGQVTFQQSPPGSSTLDPQVATSLGANLPVETSHQSPPSQENGSLSQEAPTPTGTGQTQSMTMKEPQRTPSIKHSSSSASKAVHASLLGQAPTSSRAHQGPQPSIDVPSGFSLSQQNTVPSQRLHVPMHAAQVPQMYVPPLSEDTRERPSKATPVHTFATESKTKTPGLSRASDAARDVSRANDAPTNKLPPISQLALPGLVHSSSSTEGRWTRIETVGPKSPFDHLDPPFKGAVHHTSHGRTRSESMSVRQVSEPMTGPGVSVKEASPPVHTINFSTGSLPDAGLKLGSLIHQPPGNTATATHLTSNAPPFSSFGPEAVGGHPKISTTFTTVQERKDAIPVLVDSQAVRAVVEEAPLARLPRFPVMEESPKEPVTRLHTESAKRVSPSTAQQSGRHTTPVVDAGPRPQPAPFSQTNGLQGYSSTVQSALTANSSRAEANAKIQGLLQPAQLQAQTPNMVQTSTTHVMSSFVQSTLHQDGKETLVFPTQDKTVMQEVAQSSFKPSAHNSSSQVVPASSGPRKSAQQDSQSTVRKRADSSTGTTALSAAKYHPQSQAVSNNALPLPITNSAAELESTAVAPTHLSGQNEVLPQVLLHVPYALDRSHSASLPQYKSHFVTPSVPAMQNASLTSRRGHDGAERDLSNTLVQQAQLGQRGPDQQPSRHVPSHSGSVHPDLGLTTSLHGQRHCVSESIGAQNDTRNQSSITSAEVPGPTSFAPASRGDVKHDHAPSAILPQSSYFSVQLISGPTGVKRSEEGTSSSHKILERPSALSPAAYKDDSPLGVQAQPSISPTRPHPASRELYHLPKSATNAPVVHEDQATDTSVLKYNVQRAGKSSTSHEAVEIPKIQDRNIETNTHVAAQSQSRTQSHNYMIEASACHTTVSIPAIKPTSTTYSNDAGAEGVIPGSRIPIYGVGSTPSAASAAPQNPSQHHKSRSLPRTMLLTGRDRGSVYAQYSRPSQQHDGGDVAEAQAGATPTTSTAPHANWSQPAKTSSTGPIPTLTPSSTSNATTNSSRSITAQQNGHTEYPSQPTEAQALSLHASSTRHSKHRSVSSSSNPTSHHTSSNSYHHQHSASLPTTSASYHTSISSVFAQPSAPSMPHPVPDPTRSRTPTARPTAPALSTSLRPSDVSYGTSTRVPIAGHLSTPAPIRMTPLPGTASTSSSSTVSLAQRPSSRASVQQAPEVVKKKPGIFGLFKPKSASPKDGGDLPESADSRTKVRTNNTQDNDNLTSKPGPAVLRKARPRTNSVTAPPPVMTPLPPAPQSANISAPPPLTLKILHSYRAHNISAASLEAIDGTPANTVIGSPTQSTFSNGPGIGFPSFPERDRFQATERWRNDMEADQEDRGTGRRRRPGVTFQVDGPRHASRRYAA